MKLTELRKGVRENISNLDEAGRNIASQIMDTTPLVDEKENGIRILKRIWQNDQFRVIQKCEYMNPIDHKAVLALKMSQITIEKL